MLTSRSSLGCCMLAFATLIAGCPQKSDRKAKADQAPGTSATPTVTKMTRARAEARARAFLTHLQESEWDQASKMTIPKFAKVLPAAGLSALWEQLQLQMGPFQRITATSVKQIGEAHTFRFTCAFARKSVNLIVSIDGKGRVQGLFNRPSNEARGPRRPQHPRPPYPYLAREVVFENPTDKSKHAGTLTVPKGKGPHPAAVLISGSGSQDRDETIFDHKPFWVLADALTRAGIAVLRVDDRGVGGSGGDVASATTRTFATDVVAAIDFLRGQKGIAPQKIGLIGHSEGGLIAPMVAAAHPKKVAFIVSLAGTGVPGHKVITWQVVAALRGRPGVTAAQLKQLEAIQARIMGAAIGDKKNFKATLTRALEDSNALGLGPKLTKAQVDSRVAVESTRLLSPWVQTFLKLDPALYWAKVRCPVLAINGAKDTQVDPLVNLAAIAAALRKARNKDVTTKKLAKLNHLFQTAKSGQLDEYGKIHETFAPAALTLVTNWVAQRMHR